MLAADEARVLTAGDPAKEPPRFRFSGDSLGFLSGLMTAGMVTIARRFSGLGVWAGGGGPSFEIELTNTGRDLVTAWRAGDLQLLRAALSSNPGPDRPAPE